MGAPHRQRDALPVISIHPHERHFRRSQAAQIVNWTRPSGVTTPWTSSTPPQRQDCVTEAPPPVHADSRTWRQVSPRCTHDTAERETP